MQLVLSAGKRLLLTSHNGFGAAAISLVEIQEAENPLYNLKSSDSKFSNGGITCTSVTKLDHAVVHVRSARF